MWPLFLALALAACRPGDDRAPFAESHTPPGLSARFFAPEGWAWGFVEVGDEPVQRYGVSSPSTVPRAEILILPDYGETAETWFETARDLNALGCTVWVLEGVGQGGSERTASPRDLGHVTSFDADVAAVAGMTRVVIRPGRPLILLGQGAGAVTAARAAETGLRVDGLVLSAPAFSKVAPARADLTRILFGDRRAPGAGAWTHRTAYALKLTRDPWRGAVTVAWQAANPDLRMGGPSSDWIAAFGRLSEETRRDLPSLRVPTLVLEGRGAGGCPPAPACQARAWPAAGRSLELERDDVRDAWLEAIDGFITARTGRRPPG